MVKNSSDSFRSESRSGLLAMVVSLLKVTYLVEFSWCMWFLTDRQVLGKTDRTWRRSKIKTATRSQAKYKKIRVAYVQSKNCKCTSLIHDYQQYTLVYILSVQCDAVSWLPLNYVNWNPKLLWNTLFTIFVWQYDNTVMKISTIPNFLRYFILFASVRVQVLAYAGP